MTRHTYHVHIEWTGNQGSGTSDYRTYGRQFTASAEGKVSIACSADPAFRGDASRWNPEEMLLASLSSCHKLWYLHLCSVNNIVVLAYHDHAEAIMEEGNGAQPGRFIQATLHPHIYIATQSDTEKAQALHHEAHRACFVANSVNFPIQCQAKIQHVDPATFPNKHNSQDSSSA